MNDEILNALVSTVITTLAGSLFQEGSFELLGHNCLYSVTPKIRKFKLKFEGKIWCPGWTAITGHAKTNSRSGAVEHAVRDFVNKAAGAGLISADQAREYIQRFRG